MIYISNYYMYIINFLDRTQVNDKNNGTNKSTTRKETARKKRDGG